MSRYEEDTKLMEVLNSFKVKCEHCGHKVVMTNAERVICSWCKRWVYRNSKIAFKYKLKEKLRKVKDDR